MKHKKGLPNHIAFIMDGNGRWARRRGVPRLKGHERGAQAIRAVLEELLELGIPEATFYALSSENYRRRTQQEVHRLLGLLLKYLKEEEETLLKEKMRLVVIGRLWELPGEVQEEISRVTKETSEHKRFTFRLAINYGSRLEIMDAAKELARRYKQGELGNRDLSSLEAEDFRQFLYDPGMSDPDLLIRTAGHLRLSNFLLWQCSYTEVHVTKTLWPSFRKKQLHEALEAYTKTTRKFGAVK